MLEVRGHGLGVKLHSFSNLLQLGDALNRQFEAVCETVFGEMESQAVEALDLPGCFRTRSHSYVRAIQAGCSQDDDCLSIFSLSGPQGGPKGAAGNSECGLFLSRYRYLSIPSALSHLSLYYSLSLTLSMLHVRLWLRSVFLKHLRCPAVQPLLPAGHRIAK